MKFKQIACTFLTVVIAAVSLAVPAAAASALKAPTSVTAEVQNETSVKISWKKATNAKKYQVFYSTKKTSNFKKYGTTSKTEMTVKKLKQGTTYYFRVKSVDKNGKLSAYSKTVKAVPAVVVKPEIELKLKSTAVKKDYKGDDFLLVTYKFKQNTDEAKAFYLMVNDTAYQDGVELDSMVISNDLDSTAAISKVMPGVEIEVQQGYKLRNGESDVQIICMKLLDYKDKTPLLEKTIEL